MYRTARIVKPYAALVSIAMTAGMLAVAGHMKAGLTPLEDIRTPLAVRSVAAPEQVADQRLRIEVIGMREASVASTTGRRSAV